MTDTTATTTRRTLAEANADRKPRNWGEYIVQDITAVGGMNISNMRSHLRSGTKLHMLSAMRVIGYTDPNFVPARGRVKIGDVFAVHAWCNGNGQTGTVVKDADTSDVNCQRCLPKPKAPKPETAKQIREREQLARELAINEAQRQGTIATITAEWEKAEGRGDHATAEILRTALTAMGA